MIARATLGCVAAWLLCVAGVEAREPWVVLKDCRLMRNESSDADSFHVNAAGKEYIFRLYFVDAPETDTSFDDRVKEQAEYFGLKPDQTITLGTYAKRFTREKLAQPFTVRTCMQDAMGRSKLPRYYAFVETEEGDLAELLVANGLARLHGTTAKPAGLRSPEREWVKLRQLEREAKQMKVGAWGAAVGRMAARSAKQQPKTGPNSFDQFFHPERLAASTQAEDQKPTPTVSASALPTASPAATVARAATQAVPSQPSDGKLDVNHAAAEDLMKVPGIGPVLARRIIEARPFETSDRLIDVKGIGPKTYEQIRPHFR